MESPFRDSGDVILIETLGWDGTGFPRLALHLDRFVLSAQRLGRTVDRSTAEAALRLHTSPTPLRMRMTLDVYSHLRVEAHPSPEPARHWRVGIAAERLDASDPWLGIKTSRRAAYDRVRATLPEGWDEAILLNQRGEVCDGTITTLFVRTVEGLMTPPLTSGLLPGVLRADLIAQGDCQEGLLTPADLEGAEILMGNSLRGLIPATLCP